VILQPPDTDHVGRWFAERLLTDQAGVRVVTMQRSFPGMSRETWFVTVTSDQVPEAGYVLRADLPGGSISPRSLDYEARIFQILAGTPVPVPRVLAVEQDPAWLLDGKRPFFVRELVDGVVEPDHVRDLDPAHERVRDAVLKELLTKLAAVHTLDWKALGFGEFMEVPDSPADCARDEIGWWEQLMRERQLEPFPALTESLRWLTAHPPPPPERICLRKENNGLGEEIWQGTTIVAMSDWETASLGDPALDIAVALRTTGFNANVADALAHYESASGIRISEEAVTFYGHVWSMKNVIGLHVALPLFTNGDDRRIQLVTLGLYTYLAQHALASAAGF
jgi:aminoglycoside phosphotransferase (APT) family kinase protein